ncbi:MAG: hypothetical protein AAGC47_07475 [Bacteroidota bacterium]
MKHYLACLSALLISSLLWAQISITSETFDQIANEGIPVDIHWNFGSGEFDIGQPGGGNVWDFSDITASLSYSSEYLPVEGSPFAENFPTADFYRVTITNDTDFPFINHYYYENQNGLIEIGHVTEPPATFATFRYMNPGNTMFEYPTSYQDNWVVNYIQSDTTNGIGTIAEHERTYEVDAYGTLILPGGLEEQALRIRSVHHISSTGGLDGGTYYYFITLSGSSVFLYWFLDEKVPNSGLVICDDYAFNAPHLALSNDSQLLAREQLISVFPNPFSDNLSLSFRLASNENATFSLFDISGKRVLMENLPSSG